VVEDFCSQCRSLIDAIGYFDEQQFLPLEVDLNQKEIKIVLTST